MGTEGVEVRLCLLSFCGPPITFQALYRALCREVKSQQYGLSMFKIVLNKECGLSVNTKMWPSHCFSLLLFSYHLSCGLSDTFSCCFQDSLCFCFPSYLSTHVPSQFFACYPHFFPLVPSYLSDLSVLESPELSSWTSVVLLPRGPCLVSLI